MHVCLKSQRNSIMRDREIFSHHVTVLSMCIHFSICIVDEFVVQSNPILQIIVNYFLRTYRSKRYLTLFVNTTKEKIE